MHPLDPHLKPGDDGLGQGDGMDGGAVPLGVGIVLEVDGNKVDRREDVPYGASTVQWVGYLVAVLDVFHAFNLIAPHQLVKS